MKAFYVNLVNLDLVRPGFMFHNPLVVHVLLLTHEFVYDNICIPHSWYPQCEQSMFFMCPKHTDSSPSLI